MILKYSILLKYIIIWLFIKKDCIFYIDRAIMMYYDDLR